MNIDEAVDQASREPLQGEVLNVIGSIEKDPSGKVRVYPDPHDMSRYVLIDSESVSGEVLNVTDMHGERTRRGEASSSQCRCAKAPKFRSCR